MVAQLAQTFSVGVPGEYFRKMSKADYRDWMTALGREFLQNPNDAKAKLIEFVFDMARRTLTVTDDGTGMSRDTIINKLLVLGGSEKPPGSVGGFGKAKELLFFSWERYEIHSRDNLVKGSGASYTIEPANYRQGTRCVVTFQDDENMEAIRRGVRKALELSQVTARVTLDGEAITPLRKGRCVRTEDWGAKIHLTKSVMSDYAFVRLNGVFMFRLWLSQTVKGLVVIELSGESVKLFTSNRDGMVENYSNRLATIINRLVESPKSAVREKAPVIDHYKGDGALQVFGAKFTEAASVRSTAAACVADKLADVRDTLEGANDALEALGVSEKDRAERLAEMARNEIQKELGAAGVAPSAPEIAGIVAGLGQRIKESVVGGDPAVKIREALVTLRKTLAALSYRPDFYVHRLNKFPRNIDPATWSKKYRSLALAWEAVVKQVHMDNGMDATFNIGWMDDRQNDNGSGAERMEGHGMVSYNLNPLAKELNFDDESELALELLDSAIHEVTHAEVHSHNEEFITVNARIRRATRKTDYVAIVKAAMARA